MRILFMGTPDLAVPALTALEASRHEVIGAVTQPDKPKGRGRGIQMTPVKAKALELSIPVYQPEKVRAAEFVRVLRDLRPDAIVVTAFGQILSQEILDIPPVGCINIHASLLPKYRGASPVQWAVINGDPETGVTTMMMDAGLDTGDVLEKLRIPLEQGETGGSLFTKIGIAGSELILSTLDKLEQGTLKPMPQGEEGVSYVTTIKKSLGDIDWQMEAETIERFVRGLNPWPSAYTRCNGRVIKIWEAAVIYEEYEGVCGEVVEAVQDRLYVKTGYGILAIKSLQPEGKKRMDTDAFLRGYPVAQGTILERSQ